MQEDKTWLDVVLRRVEEEGTLVAGFDDERPPLTARFGSAF